MAVRKTRKRTLSSFPKSLPMQLLRARELLMQRFRPQLHAHGLTEQQWRVLRALWEVPEMSNQQLSDRCVLHLASMSRILPKLESDGLVTRRQIEHDRRNLSVQLTDAGRDLVDTLLPENNRLFRAVVNEVGHNVIADAYEALEALNAALSAGREGPIMTSTSESRKNAD
jgi:homoprotocatechuate degradation regulator HpaR